MALQSGTTSFGKREIHRVWSERAKGGVSVFVSRRRGAAASMLLGLISAGLGVLAFRFAIDAPTPREIFVGIALAGLSFASLWATLRVLRAATKRGPVLRLDPSRMVVCTTSGELFFPWENVSLTLGPAFLTIRTRPTGRRAEAASPREIVVPVLLLRGGAAGLREAIRGVRPDALQQAGSGR